MDIVQIVNSIIGREQKYEDVDVKYLAGDSFRLFAERGDRIVTYHSHTPYTITVTHPILGLFKKGLGSKEFEEQEMAPGLTMVDSEKDRALRIVYDKRNHTTILTMQDENSEFLGVIKSGSQVSCSDSLMSDQTQLNLVSDHIKLFRQQQRLLDVNTYQRHASEKTVQSYSF